MSHYLIDLGIIVVLIAGISQFRTPRGARAGNLLAAVALGGAVVVVFVRHSIGSIELILVAAAATTAWSARDSPSI